MAMKTFTLQYSIGPSGETAHITKMRNDLYRMFHTDYILRWKSEVIQALSD
ncbi:hypothetical protein SAMN06265370_102347 [Puniceibacterium sediminis]|uniref:Uncharacterized protein n=1 Tax=Puniceibacterium sediminis TaxID=1608407 RepID=A0A238VLR5_9RHOB|nr:hypothetical protein SAMN06265370_102347 [Puniceibacterium sediminis]